MIPVQHKQLRNEELLVSCTADLAMRIAWLNDSTIVGHPQLQPAKWRSQLNMLPAAKVVLHLHKQYGIQTSSAAKQSLQAAIDPETRQNS
jgi:hypothetical protein